ncbi:hypothetical protein ACHHV8_28625 [Paenibacillus sp. TAB 01]|uniref:hypothetical protein n=1 Tax=Paenibacillus sp. TAB 01 TaxID=3368988 RepID=UPI0037537B3A
MDPAKGLPIASLPTTRSAAWLALTMRLSRSSEMSGIGTFCAVRSSSFKVISCSFRASSSSSRFCSDSAARQAIIQVDSW